MCFAIREKEWGNSMMYQSLSLLSLLAVMFHVSFHRVISSECPHVPGHEYVKSLDMLVIVTEGVIVPS